MCGIDERFLVINEKSRSSDKDEKFKMTFISTR